MSRMLAWRYGLLEPLDWDEDCEREMRSQVDLWNRLVGVERAHRGRIAGLYGADEPVARIEAALAEIEGRIEELLAERRKRRKAARQRVATPELDGRLDDLRVLRREILPRLKEARAAVRAAKREELKGFADIRYRAVTEARQQSGLWWGNYNAVCAAFDVACKELAPGEEVRPHAHDGRGRLTNQIQQGISAEALLTRGHAQLRIEPLPKGHPLGRRGAGKRGQLVLLVATVWSRGREGRKMCRWPMVMHRPFPEGALVKTVTITRISTGRSRYRAPPASGEVERINRASPDATRKCQPDTRWLVSFACALPDVEPTLRNVAAGVDTGWRKLPPENGGGLRIATIADDNGGIDHVILPQRWLERRAWAARVQSEADDAVNDVLAVLRSASGTLPAPLSAIWEPMSERLRPPPTQLVELLQTWETRNRGWRIDLRHRLDDWRNLRIEYSDLVDKLALARREIYRLAAKDLTERYGVIGVDKIAVAKLGSRKERTARDNTNDMPPETRKMRSWAAPYDFVSELRRAAAARGVRVQDLVGPTTLVCHHCGTRQGDRPAHERAELFWRCTNPACRRLWDQDENAAKNVLAALTASGGALPAKAGIAPAPDKTKAFERARITRKRSARKPSDNSFESGGDSDKV